jgi:hypothetical protein
VKLSDPADYYEDRDVPHAAQGDIYEAIPFEMATLITPQFEAAGARKRSSGSEPVDGVVQTLVAPGVLLHYTCGITAQPPGTEGYAHEYRSLAPIVGLGELKSRFKMNNNELRKIVEGHTVQGFMYLPQSDLLVLDDPDDPPEDEYAGHAAALLYRPGTVSQALLDSRTRLHQLSGRAIKILDASIINTYSPNNFAADELADPDLSNGWAAD